MCLYILRVDVPVYTESRCACTLQTRCVQTRLCSDCVVMELWLTCIYIYLWTECLVAQRGGEEAQCEQERVEEVYRQEVARVQGIYIYIYMCNCLLLSPSLFVSPPREGPFLYHSLSNMDSMDSQYDIMYSHLLTCTHMYSHISLSSSPDPPRS